MALCHVICHPQRLSKRPRSPRSPAYARHNTEIPPHLASTLGHNKASFRALRPRQSASRQRKVTAPGYGVDRIAVEDHAHFSAQPHTQLPRRTLLAIPPLANDTKSLSSSAALRLAEDSLLLLPASAFDPWPSLRRSLRSAAVPRHIVGNDTHFHQYEPQLLQFPSQTNCVRLPLAISVLNAINPWARDWLQMRTNWKSVQLRPSVLGT